MPLVWLPTDLSLSIYNDITNITTQIHITINDKPTNTFYARLPKISI